MCLTIIIVILHSIYKALIIICIDHKHTFKYMYRYMYMKKQLFNGS